MERFASRMFAMLVAASLTPWAALANTLEMEGEVMAAGSRFDVSMAKPAAPLVAESDGGREGGKGELGALGALRLQAISQHGNSPVPSPKHCCPPEEPRGFWGSIGRGLAAAGKGAGIAARELTGAAVGITVGLIGLGLGLAYAGSVILPVIAAAGVDDYSWGDDRGRSYGQILFDHMMSPVTWAAGGFRKARRTTIDALS